MVVDRSASTTYPCGMSSVADERHPATEDLRLPEVLAALADTNRLALIRTLVRVGESPCTELYRTARMRIGRSTFSHHQKILREAGVIRERINGAQRILTVRADDLNTRFPGLLDAIVHSN